MMRGIALVLALLWAGPLGAQDAPNGSDLLFEAPHWTGAGATGTVTYRYARSSGAETVFGPPVEDRIRLTLEPGATAADRTVRVEMFSGPRRRAAGPFEDVGGNPALVLFLEQHLEGIARVLKSNPRYLKNAIRAGLRERATTTPATVTVAGRDVPGWRIEVQPFLADPMRERMRGLETLTYRFLVSDAVPGAIAAIEARAILGDGGSLLTETLTYDPKDG